MKLCLFRLIVIFLRAILYRYALCGIALNRYVCCTYRNLHDGMKRMLQASPEKSVFTSCVLMSSNGILV